MPGTNEILPFATNVAANVMSQADYEAQFSGAGFVQLGFEAGTAYSPQLNKVWRQSSFMSSGLAGFMANQDIDVLDDGDLDTLVDNVEKAILKATQASPCYAADSGTANALIAVLDPAPSAIGQDFTVDVKIANTNTGASTLVVNGFGPYNITRSGAPLTGGELVVGQIATFKRDIASNSWQVTSAVGATASVFSGAAPTAGTANAQTLASVSPAGYMLHYGYIVNFTAGVTNTGAATLNVSATGAVTIKKIVSGALVDVAAGDITNGSSYTVTYNGTFYVLQSSAIDTSSFLQKANNLSDLASASAGRSNLGLGTSAVHDLTTDGTFAANSDNIIPSEKAVKTYVDNTVINGVSGLTPSGMTGSATTAAMTIAGGSASTGHLVIPAAGPYSWAVSNGNAVNGYQGGTTLPNSATIHMFVCQGSLGVGTFASTSLTPTLPAGYDVLSRRIFSFNTDSSGAPIAYNVVEVDGGAIVCYLVNQLTDISVTNQGTSGVLYALTVPTGFPVSPLYRCSSNFPAAYLIMSGQETNVACGSATTVWSSPPGYDQAFLGSSLNYTVGSCRDGMLTTNNSGQIRIAGQSAGMSVYWITRGFKDFRRV